MATALDLIGQSLKIIGVLAAGESVQAADAKDCLTCLNQMLDRWSNEKMMVYHITSSLYDIVPGVGTYSIGPGATWDTGVRRPIMVQKWGAFVRQTISPSLYNDYKLDYIPADRYANIFLKKLTTNFPSSWTFETAWPVGTIKLFPVPTLALQFGLNSFDQFSTFNLTDYVELPPGYESAIVYNLALDISPQYGVDPMPMVLKRANQAKINLQTTNSDQIIMTTDESLISHGTFNIYAG